MGIVRPQPQPLVGLVPRQRYTPHDGADDLYGLHVFYFKCKTGVVFLHLRWGAHPVQRADLIGCPSGASSNQIASKPNGG